jgi:two-component system, OmpR family, phosphate regulon sensor histidine kinase PhoR
MKIMIIDDDRHMRNACSRILQKAGWSVVCAETGVEALKEISKEPESFAVVLLDQLMPEMSGTDVLAQIKAIDPNLPVIVVTGYSTSESERQLKKEGAFDCLLKPFTPEQLRLLVIKAART